MPEKRGILQLSILIATLPDYKKQFNVLHRELKRQIKYCDEIHPALGMVEVVINDDKRFTEGGLSIGKKREALVREAKANYLCFLDYDESIAPNYVEELLRLCYDDNDIGTFRVLVKMSNFWTVLDMSLSYKENAQLTPDAIVTRPPWHVCPMRSSFAKHFEFPDLNNAEDFVWMEKVLTLCMNEKHTDKILYQYNHMKISEADKVPLP